MLVESYGADEALAMLVHLEHRMRTKQVGVVRAEVVRQYIPAIGPCLFCLVTSPLISHSRLCEYRRVR